MCGCLVGGGCVWLFDWWWLCVVVWLVVAVYGCLIGGGCVWLFGWWWLCTADMDGWALV